MDDLMHRLCALAQRYDERMLMITARDTDEFHAIDKYQIQVLEKTYHKEAFVEKMKQPQALDLVRFLKKLIFCSYPPPFPPPR